MFWKAGDAKRTKMAFPPEKSFGKVSEIVDEKNKNKKKIIKIMMLTATLDSTIFLKISEIWIANSNGSNFMTRRSTEEFLGVLKS